MKIGPTGEYPTGKPYFDGDVGHIHSGFEIVPPNCEWTFGVLLDHVVLTPEKARILADAFRKMIGAAFGSVMADKAALKKINVYVYAEADGTVRVDFILHSLGLPITKFTARPEIFLAIAERVDEEVTKIRRWNM